MNEWALHPCYSSFCPFLASLFFLCPFIACLFIVSLISPYLSLSPSLCHLLGRHLLEAPPSSVFLSGRR